MPRFVPGDESSFDVPDYVPHEHPAVPRPAPIPTAMPTTMPGPMQPLPEPLFAGYPAPAPNAVRPYPSWPQVPAAPSGPRPSPLRGCLVVLVVVVVTVIAGIVIGAMATLTSGHGSPAKPRSTSNLPTGTPSVRPSNAYPPVLADFDVVEAIDLPNRPTPGPTWDASGGPVGDGLRRAVYLTPCGVLVTATLPQFFVSNAPPGAQISITGYDIATGKQLWTHALEAVSGLKDPTVSMSVNPTFTPDCRMVLSVEAGAKMSDHVTVVLTLQTGDVQLVDGYCAAAGDGWLGCWGTNVDGHSSGIQPVDLAHPDAPPVWWDSAYVSMHYPGDAVAVGDIWTPGGYRDPATGWVMFGADTRTHSPWGTPPAQDDVMYVEPQRPGGFRSGLVVRVAGDLTADRTGCHIMLWNPQTDQPVWKDAALTACGGSNITWTASGAALIVTHTMIDGNTISTTTRAFSLADGRDLWQYDGELDVAPWDAGMAFTHTPEGVTANYVIEQANTNVADEPFDMIRIADGTRVHMSGFRLMTVADTMVYRLQKDASGQQQLAAAHFDAATGAISPKWMLPTDQSDTDMLIHWTFVTGGTMYLVSSNWTTGHIQVTPLLQ